MFFFWLALLCLLLKSFSVYHPPKIIPTSQIWTKQATWRASKSRWSTRGLLLKLSIISTKYMSKELIGLSIFNYWLLNIVFPFKTTIKSQNQFFLTIPAWTTFRQLPYSTQPTEQHWILHKWLADIILLSQIEILLLVILEWCLNTMTLYRSKKLVKSQNHKLQTSSKV